MKRDRLQKAAAFALATMACGLGFVFFTSCIADFPLVPHVFNIDNLIGEKAGKAKVTPITKSGGDMAIHVPGKIYSYHGFDCANSAPPNLARIQKTFRLPKSKLTGALVWLNGWKLRYLDEEEEALGFGVAMGETKSLSGNQLSWEVVGGMQPEKPDQEIEICYYYTVLAWTSSFMPGAYVHQETFKTATGRIHGDDHSALLLVPRVLQAPQFEPAAFVGVVPRGFGFLWTGEDYFLQAAHYLAPSERYVYGQLRDGSAYQPAPKLPPRTSSGAVQDWVNKGFVSWQTSAIFKNGDAADVYYFADLAAAVSANLLGMIEPHFGIAPMNQTSSIGGNPGTTVEDFTVENIPFHFAMPVLKGWNLFLPKDDEQIRQIGIWIERFEFKRTGTVGRLKYRVVTSYEDEERSPLASSHAVAILGVKNVYKD